MQAAEINKLYQKVIFLRDNKDKPDKTFWADYYYNELVNKLIN